MTDRESTDYVKRIIKNAEKVIWAGQPVNEVKLYTTDKGLEMLKRVVGLADREPCEDMINRKHLLSEIDDLMKSPWFNRYRDDCGALHFGYIERKEAVEIVRDLCVKTEPPVHPKAKTEWIPIKWHNITEEERKREGYPKDWLTILDCRMPNNDEEVFVTVKGRNGNLYVETDTCYFDGTCYSSDSGYDWIDDVVAWMPLPEPYRKESEEW